MQTLLGLHKQTRQAIFLPPGNQHCYIIGGSGTGKSTLLRSVIGQSIQQGQGVCVLDPHGQAPNSLIDQVISDIPAYRANDIILLDVNDTDPFGLNLFSCPDPTNPKEIQDTVSRVFNIFERIYSMDRATTARINMYMHALVYLFIHNPTLTVLDIPRLLDTGVDSDDLRRFLVSHLPVRPDYEFTRHFWESYFTKRNAMGRNDEVAGIFNKFRELSSALLWAVFSQNKNTVDIARVMKEKKILLVKLNADWNDITTLIGGILIAQIKDATFNRSESSPPFSLFVDEFQRMATRDFATLFTEARKGNLHVTVAHQTLSQVDEYILGTAMQAGTHVYFRVTGEDAKHLVKNLDTTPPVAKVLVGYTPIQTYKQDVVGHLIQHGHTNPLVNQFAQQFLRIWRDEAKKGYDWGDYLNPFLYRAMLGEDITTFSFAEAQGLFFLENACKCGQYLTALAWGAEAYASLTPPLYPWYAKTIYEGARKAAPLVWSAPPTSKQYQQAIQTLDAAARMVVRWHRWNYFLDELDTVVKDFRDCLQAWTPKYPEQTWYHINPYDVQWELVAIENTNPADIVRSTGVLTYIDWQQKPIHGQETKFYQEADLVRIVEQDITTDRQSFLDTMLLFKNVMYALASDPIMTDSGQSEPRYETQRQFMDMENELANRLSGLPNYEARVKILTNEYSITTLPPPAGISPAQVQKRIARIKQQNLAAGYITSRAEVEQEVMQRLLPVQPILGHPQNGPPLQPIPLPQSRRRKIP